MGNIEFKQRLVTKEASMAHDNLTRQGMQLCSKCYLSGKDSESINHLFLQCEVTHQLRQFY